MARPRQAFIVFVCFACLVLGTLRWNFNSPFTKFNSPILFNAKDRFDFNATTHQLGDMINTITNLLMLNESVSEEESITATGASSPPIISQARDSEKVNESRDKHSTSTFHETCFPVNSKAWLQGSRIGNIQVPDEWVDHMMHPHRLLHSATLETILDQTLCYKTGGFRNVIRQWNASDPEQILYWEFRLLYLAIHRHMHMPAFEEYQQRQACGLRLSSSFDNTTSSSSPTINNETTNNASLPLGTIGNFDYECPKAKFLVTVLNGRAGMGAVVKNGVMPSIFMAFATGRIPLFLQAVPGGEGIPDFVTKPLLLTSCERRDWQCIFLPTSPCVLTVDDLRQAAVLSAEESRDLKQSGYLTDILNQTRVIISGSFPAVPIHTRFSIHDTIRAQAYDAVQEILHVWRNESIANDSEDISTEQWNVLTTAAASIGVPFSSDAVGESRKWRYLRAGLVYVMRPNPTSRHAIDLQVKEALPNHTDPHQQRQYFGLPIRGSDKCRFESTCLPFETYMQLMVSKLQQHGISDRRGTIVLTSEDPTVLPRRHAYELNSSFPLDFVVNERDVQPGTGKSTRYYDRADAIMISSLVVFKLQLMSNVLVANCCSNFHNLLFELVREGCGADPHMEWQCLNEMEDPRFRICCGWTKDGDCQQIWADHRARISAAAEAAAAVASQEHNISTNATGSTSR